MSAWQRWHASDFMKYCDGMLPPCLVWAELGKNFPEAPSPSRSMESGGMRGLTMRFALASRQPTSRVHHTPADTAAVKTANPANPVIRLANVLPSHPPELSQTAASKSDPPTHTAITA